MNKKQTVALWLGIVVTVLTVLFPPGGTGLIFFRETYHGEIEFRILSLLIFSVALVTAGLIYTLRTKKVDSDKKDDQKQ